MTFQSSIVWHFLGGGCVKKSVTGPFSTVGTSIILVSDEGPEFSKTGAKGGVSTSLHQARNSVLLSGHVVAPSGLWLKQGTRNQDTWFLFLALLPVTKREEAPF